MQSARRGEWRGRCIPRPLLLLNLIIPRLQGALEISNSLLLEVEELRPREGKPLGQRANVGLDLNPGPAPKLLLLCQRTRSGKLDGFNERGPRMPCVHGPPTLTPAGGRLSSTSGLGV